MRIAIAERLHPYSHTPGVCCLLPGSTRYLQVFPALYRIYDLSTHTPELIEEIPQEVEGPVLDFTVQQDLEKGEILISGHGPTGQGQTGYFYRKEKGQRPSQGVDRLSLGNHKAQDWTLIRRRLNLEEIFPLWHRLGQLVPPLQEGAFDGTLSLLAVCQDAIESNRPETIVPTFKNLFLAGFEEMLLPRLEDNLHQGFHLPEVTEQTASPLWLLTRGAELIRSLFFQMKGKEIQLLPALPPEFHCGRLLGIKTPFGSIDMEWSKKTIRRVIFHAQTTGEITFNFGKDIRSVRLRQGNKDRGHQMNKGSSFSVEAGLVYYLDHFEK